MQIITHRGWWTTPEEKNTRVAFRRALEANYGIETDLRDMGGEIVVSHDMPIGANIMLFAEFLQLYAEIGNPTLLALNIKADGLSHSIKSLLSRFGVTNAFVFDMAVPDALSYTAADFMTYTRHSEYEPLPSFYELADGVWMDAFMSDWIVVESIVSHLDAGKQVALVSPELHRRPHGDAWSDWKVLNHSHVSLCTDFPDKAEAFFKA